MVNKVIVDTNLILDDENIIYKLTRKYDMVIIPTTVLVELDKHKYDPELSYSARNAITSILNFKKKHPDRIHFHIDETALNGPDAKIIETAMEIKKTQQVAIATKDVSMSFVADSKNIETELFDIVMNDVFDPYVHLETDDLIMGDDYFTYLDEYEFSAYDYAFKFLEKVVEKKFKKHRIEKDGWFYIIIKDENTEKPRNIIYAHNPIKKSIKRIDHVYKYNEIDINFPKLKLKPLDIYQKCAIHALKEAPNVLITGSWGTGKTLLSTAYALSQYANKIFVTRPTIGINKKYDIGFLKGDKVSKMLDWCGGFISALYYIYNSGDLDVGSDKIDIASHNGSMFDYVREYVFEKKFEVMPINTIQGMSLLENDIMIADEAQLIDVDYMSMLLSRPTSRGKLVLLGSLQQTYSVVKPSQSGLLKLLRILPHKQMAYIRLDKQHRGEILELADKLQDKTII